MNINASKTNQESDFLNQRLDEIRMSGHERLMAKARLARAEAVADALFVAAQAVARLFKRLTAKAARPAAPTALSAG
jgi:hypothetical protein